MKGHRRLVLASGSPRRREMVAAFSRRVEAMAPAGLESRPRGREEPEQYVTRVALEKAMSVAERAGQAVIVGADTVVTDGGQILGKPANRGEAVEMLDRLRGRAHRVVTGVVVLDSESDFRLMSAKATDVTMRRYSDDEIETYVASGQTFDKAGAYAVQDDSFRPANSVEGCYLNVVGLPLCELVSLLARIGAPAELRPGWSPPEHCKDCPLHPTRNGHVRC